MKSIQRASRWIMKKIHSWGPLVLFIGLLPSLALALAGIGERSSFFHYNNFTSIERGHPSDFCSGSTKWCLALYKEGYRNLKGIDSTFEQLNIPSDSATPYLIGQRSSDNSWLVYDLEKEQVLIADTEYQKVIDVWNSLGLAQPTYVNARNTRQLLTKTKDSKVLRWKRDLQMYLFLGLFPFTLVALIFWYLNRKTKQQYKQTKSKVSLLFSYMFIAPVFVINYMAISSLIAIIRQNW